MLQKTLYEQAKQKKGPYTLVFKELETTIDYEDEQCEAFYKKYENQRLTIEGFQDYLDILSSTASSKKSLLTRKILQTYDLSWPLSNLMHDKTTELLPFLSLAYSKQLAFESYSLNEARLGICLLGVHRDLQSLEKLKLMAVYEEFDSQAALAIRCISESPNRALMEIAQRVDQGWGKISFVELMVCVKEADIREWLLLEGYQNNVDYGYLVGHCMLEGRLREKLDDIKGLLLYKSSIVDLMRSLLFGSPGIDIQDYEYAAEITLAYFKLLQQTKIDSKDYLIIVEVRRWLESNDEWKNTDLSGWDDNMLRKKVYDCALNLLKNE